MLESLGSKSKNQGKRPSTDKNPNQEEALKCPKLGYKLRKKKETTFNGIMRRGN
jgi:hypothetical protein